MIERVEYLEELKRWKDMDLIKVVTGIYVNKRIDSKKKYYVFLDEVQNVFEFQKAVDSLYIKKNVDVY